MAASEDGGHAEVLQFELFPSHKMTVCLVEDVENAAELRAEVLQQKFDASFLDAAMVSPGSQPIQAGMQLARRSCTAESGCACGLCRYPTFFSSTPQRTRLCTRCRRTH